MALSVSISKTTVSSEILSPDLTVTFVICAVSIFSPKSGSLNSDLEVTVLGTEGSSFLGSSCISALGASFIGSSTFDLFSLLAESAESTENIT